jgi:hypothetical protein
MIQLDGGRHAHGGSSSCESEPSLSDSAGGKKKKLGRNSVVQRQLNALKNFGAPPKQLNGSTIQEHANESSSKTSRPSEYATEKSSSDWGDGPGGDDGSVRSFTAKSGTGRRSLKSSKNVKSTQQLGLPADPGAPVATY